MSGLHARFVPPPPPKTPKAAASRRLVIDVATRLFIERGYHAVSMQDVADRAELTKGGVYGHFRSKGQLLVEVIRWKLSELEQSAVVIEAMEDFDSAVGLLVYRAGREIRLLEVDAAAAARHDPDVAAGMAAFYAERQAALRRALAGVVPDAKTVAWLVSALAAGIGAKEAIGIRPPTLQRIRAVLQPLATGNE